MGATAIRIAGILAAICRHQPLWWRQPAKLSLSPYLAQTAWPPFILRRLSGLIAARLGMVGDTCRDEPNPRIP